MTADTHTQPVCRVLPEVRCPSASTKSPCPRRPSAARVTQSYVAAHLGVTTRTVRDMTSDGRLTGYRLNKGFVRYDLNEVDAALKPYGASVSA